MERPYTISDVAKKLGVSKSTVSRALNNSPEISDATKERIRKVAQALNYEPNHIARSLTTKKTWTVGVLLEDISNSFFTEVAKGIETVMNQAGYMMLLTSSDFNAENEYSLTKNLIRNRVDGMLITPISSESITIELLKQRKVPFFIMNAQSEDDTVSWIDTDNFKGGYLAAKYLLELGHRRFMFVRSMILFGNRQRYAGFEKAIAEYGLDMRDNVILGDAVNSKAGYEVVRAYLKKHGKKNLPSAILTTNDATAIGVMECLLEHEIRIPEDVSIIGYDDINIAALIRVPLTTIHQPKFKMGELAARKLLERLSGEGQGKAEHIVLEPRLFVRKSCKEYKERRA